MKRGDKDATALTGKCKLSIAKVRFDLRLPIRTLAVSATCTDSKYRLLRYIDTEVRWHEESACE